MSLTFNEFYNKKTGLTVGVDRLLFSEQSSFQKVEVLETDTWGNIMTIDGMVMLSEKDEFVYHEMLSHVPLFSHPDPQRILIIGGGDGGTAREVMRHPSIQTVDLVEIDRTVVRAAKKFLPEVGDWQNPKLNVFYKDGIQFVQDIGEPYDVILIDGSDPVGPAEGLFKKDFIQACYDGLTADGILVTQTESPWVSEYHSGMQQIFKALDDIFIVSKMYLAYIPLYPAGMWSFGFASKGVNPLSEELSNNIDKRLDFFGLKLKYYNAEIHRSCFALPNFVEKLLNKRLFGV